MMGKSFQLSTPTLLFAMTLLLSACAPQRLPSERCSLEPVNASCKAMMQRYFFDQERGSCREYIYDGCGPVVPFESMEQCRQLCEESPEPSPAVSAPETVNSPPRGGGLRHDPVEDDPRYAQVFRNIDAEVRELLADHPGRGGEGFFTIYWATKKRLLKQKYGIDWRSPGELNPQVMFD